MKAQRTSDIAVETDHTYAHVAGVARLLQQHGKHAENKPGGNNARCGGEKVEAWFHEILLFGPQARYEAEGEPATRMEDWAYRPRKAKKPCARHKPDRHSRKLHNVELIAVRQVLRLGMVSSAFMFCAYGRCVRCVQLCVLILPANLIQGREAGLCLGIVGIRKRW